jgi:hypothetical protein
MAKLYTTRGRIFYEDTSKLALLNGAILNSDSGGTAYSITGEIDIVITVSGTINYGAPATLTHTVKFSGAVDWPVGVGNDVAGVSFTTDGAGGTCTVNSATGKGTDTLVYDVTWSIGAPVAGETITYHYDSGPGVYFAAGGDPVDDALTNASLVMTNCADP